MDSALSAISNGEVTGILLVGGLSLIRLLPVVFLVPFLGGRLVPGPVKLGLALALTVVLSPTVAVANAGAGLALQTGLVVLLAVKEAFIGLVIGFLTALVFYAVMIGGAVIDTVRGETMATALVPSLSERASPTSALGVQLLIVVFLALDGHHLLFTALAESFRVIPVTVFPSAGLGLDGLFTAVVTLTGEMFLIALALSLPVIAAAFLVDTALGVLGRVAPQVHVFFLGMPIKALLSVVVVLLALAAMVDVMAGGLARSQQWVRWLIHLVEP